jgi:DNA-binding transcriptional LysR family regulator
MEDQLYSEELQFMDEVCESPRIMLRSTSITAQYKAAVAGMGLAVLPIFIAGKDPNLQEVLPGEIAIKRTYWISTSTELKDFGRIRAVWNFLREIVAKNQKVILSHHD